jgi:hypothetical protein
VTSKFHVEFFQLGGFRLGRPLGVFSGERRETQVYPIMRNMMLANE